MKNLCELDSIKRCGIHWLKEEIIDSENDKKTYCWWGICKKTKKVAFMRVISSNFYEFFPLILSDVYYSEDHCDDGKYCLNLSCPHATNSKLIDAIFEQESELFKDLNEKDVENYFKRSINFIHTEYMGQYTDEEIKDIFVDGLSNCTINNSAFGTTIGD